MYTISVVGGVLLTSNQITKILKLFICLYTLLCIQITPTFAATTVNNTAIKAGNITNGVITVSQSTAKAGSTVTFTVTPATGYKMKTGSLYYTQDGTKIQLADNVRSITVPNSWDRTYTEYGCWEETDYTQECSGGTWVPGNASNCECAACETQSDPDDCYYWCYDSCGHYEGRTCVSVPDGSHEECGDYEVTKTYYVGSITIYAEFVPSTVSVSFNSNGGTSVSSQTKTINSTYGTLPIPTRTGYTFGGWYKESSLTNQVTSSTTVSATTAHTLYAKWTANTYTLSFNSNGGSTISNKTVTYDSTYGGLSSPTKAGYTFQGWYLESSFDNAVTSSTIVKTASNHTLYAKWTANTNTPYTVHYYLEQLDGSYMYKESKEFAGTTDTQINLADIKAQIVGFTYSKLIQ